MYTSIFLFRNLSIYPIFYLSIHPPIQLFIYPNNFLYIYMYCIYLLINPSLYLSIPLLIHPFSKYPSIYPYIFLHSTIHLYVYSYNYLHLLSIHLLFIYHALSTNLSINPFFPPVSHIYLDQFIYLSMLLLLY